MKGRREGERRGRRQFCLGHVKLELLIGCPDRDAESVVGYGGLKFGRMLRLETKIEES